MAMTAQMRPLDLRTMVPNTQPSRSQEPTQLQDFVRLHVDFTLVQWNSTDFTNARLHNLDPDLQLRLPPRISRAEDLLCRLWLGVAFTNAYSLYSHWDGQLSYMHLLHLRRNHRAPSVYFAKSTDFPDGLLELPGNAHCAVLMSSSLKLPNTDSTSVESEVNCRFIIEADGESASALLQLSEIDFTDNVVPCDVPEDGLTLPPASPGQHRIGEFPANLQLHMQEKYLKKCLEYHALQDKVAALEELVEHWSVGDSKVSDKQLVLLTDFTKKLQNGDEVMADRGFNVTEELPVLGKAGRQVKRQAADAAGAVDNGAGPSHEVPAIKRPRSRPLKIVAVQPQAPEPIATTAAGKLRKKADASEPTREKPSTRKTVPTNTPRASRRKRSRSSPGSSAADTASEAPMRHRVRRNVSRGRPGSSSRSRREGRARKHHSLASSATRSAKSHGRMKKRRKSRHRAWSSSSSDKTSTPSKGGRRHRRVYGRASSGRGRRRVKARKASSHGS
ncbi:hypothetical protein HPB51_027791 [Rhipicephalus microplus]|uniref:Uncharacterized protein n=1 Tax=Rhipicephalus microplus TaxID=6941 RepID=A0A9J6CZB4_RHIMP|nr:hypothetical protein HPB51_027791 [Rhipicephalus microplus]